MKLQLNDEQILFQDSLRKFFAEALPVDALRRYGDQDLRFDAGLWRQTCDLGVSGVLVPEEYGGSGLSILDAALVSEAIGGAAAPINFVGSSIMSVKALLFSASASQLREWLPRIVEGDVRMAVALASCFSGQTGRAELRMEGGYLTGRVDGVFDIGGATHILTYLPDGRVVIVEVGAHGVGIGFRRSLDRTRPIADVEFENAEGIVMEGGNDPVQAAWRVVAIGRVMLAADTLGAAQTMMDKAVAYAKEREQFDRIIGSFQGVKYMCADMVTMLAPCRAFVWSGALAQEAGDDASRLVACHVKAHVSDVGRDVSRLATEVHGGIGFTDLLGLHYWLRRISFNRQMLGGAEVCRREAARLQGWMAA